MCGRYTLRTPARDVARAFRATESEVWLPGFDAPRFNVAPAEAIPAIRSVPGAGRQLAFLRWGLVPSWADSLAVGAKMINARAETLTAKPAFRRAIAERRCVIPCDGFYEWRSISGRKQPFHISLAGGGLFALAGLWDAWRRDGRCVETCAIITTEANPAMAALHDRMPAILSPEAIDAWLDPEQRDPARLAPMLVPYPEPLAIREANPMVNRVGRDSPECLTNRQRSFDWDPGEPG